MAGGEKGDKALHLGNSFPVSSTQPHGINPGVLLVELIMSADRIITASEIAENPSDPNEWNAATLLGHLLQVDEEVWIARLNILLAPDYLKSHPEGASFPWWEPEPTQTRARFVDHDRALVAAEFLAMRTSLLMLLRGVAPHVWSLPWRHESRGELTLTDLILWILEHDEEHRSSLLTLAKAR